MVHIMELLIVQFSSGSYYFRFDRSHPVLLHNYKAIYSVKTQHILAINTINLAGL